MLVMISGSIIGRRVSPLVVCLISVVLDPELCALSLGSECVLEKVRPAGS